MGCENLTVTTEALEVGPKGENESTTNFLTLASFD